LLKKIQRNILVFIPSIEGGGVEKNLFLIINFLIKNNFNIVLITANPESKNKFHKKIKIISPKNKNTRNFSRYKKYIYCLFLLLKFLSNNNFTVLSFQANLYAIIVTKVLCKKIIIRSNSSPSGWSQNPIKKIIYKILFKLADSIIVNSKDFAKQMYEIFNVKCKVIYNPLNKEEIIKKSKERFFNKFLYKNKNFFKIISVGRFVDQKDHLTLLKAFQIIYKKINAKLILMGQGINKEKYLEFIKNNNLQNNVLILKFNNNPYKVISNANIFVLSSQYEGLPNVLLEAIALKKFIISTNCPTGPREILMNGKLGLLYKVGDYRNLSKLILKYYYNQKKFNYKIQEAYKSLNRFDFNKNCQKYLKLLNNS
jgi:glycosyltransferase involved in cell wall biosynthesis